MKNSHRLVRHLSAYRWELCFFLFFFIIFSVFWSNAITFNEKGDLVAGHANLWGDWAIHFTMGSAMAYRELLPTSSPLMLDADFSYPFATNLLSAALVRLGVPFHLAFVIPSFIFSIFFLTTVYVFFRLFLKNRYVALFAASLFFFNGGVGFYYYLVDAFNSSSPLSTLINPPHEYTNHDPEHLKWISVLSSMVFPQRAFALGAGTCLVALSLILYSFQLLDSRTRPSSWKANVLAGVLLGFLPILHTHSFLAAFVILSFWCIADLVVTDKNELKTRLLQWLVIVGVTSVIALPIIFTYFIGNVGGHFFKWFPGWYAKELNINWFLMWFKNWTFVPFFGFAGFCILIASQQNKRQRWHTALILTPGLLLFLVPNLFLTQPWLWDNTKLFIWSSVFLSPLAAFTTFYIFAKGGVVLALIVRLVLWFKDVFKPNRRYMLIPLDYPAEQTREQNIEEAEVELQEPAASADVDPQAQELVADPEAHKVFVYSEAHEAVVDSEAHEAVVDSEAHEVVVDPEAHIDEFAADAPDLQREDISSDEQCALMEDSLSTREQAQQRSSQSLQYVELRKYISEETRERVTYWSNALRRVIFVSLMLFMCSAGFLDAYYTARTDLHSFTMYNKNELALAEWVKDNTPVDAVWLTSTKHNHWLFNLTGRRALMTYTGWLWTHGYDYRTIERDAKRIFQTGNLDLVEKYGVDYIIVDRAAKKDMRANTRRLNDNFPVIKRLGQYRVYSTRKDLGEAAPRESSDTYSEAP